MTTPTLQQLTDTITTFTAVIKKQQDRITKLEETVQKLAEDVAPTELSLIDRYTISSKLNRNLNAHPEVVAFAAHLLHVRQVPASRIAKVGLMSASKMQGLTSWKSQHLLDYCEINDVSYIYEDGVSPEIAKTLVSDYDLLESYLNRT